MAGDVGADVDDRRGFLNRSWMSFLVFLSVFLCVFIRVSCGSFCVFLSVFVSLMLYVFYLCW